MLRDIKNNSALKADSGASETGKLPSDHTTTIQEGAIEHPPGDLSAELQDLIAREKKIAEAAKAMNTKRAYSSDWNSFVSWCIETGLSHCPAHPDTIRMYVVFLDKIGRAPSTIKRACTSIRLAHTLSDYESPITEAVKQTCQGIYRIRGVEQTKKSALTLDALQRCLKTIFADIIGIRDRALLLTGWTAALRRSELVSIQLDDLNMDTKGIILNIRHSKTDQFGKGRKIGLPYIDENPDMCAPRAIKKWLEVSLIKTGPIFRGLGKSGRNRMIQMSMSDKGLNAQSVARIVKKYAELAGYNPDDFGGHSLRSGLATTLAAAGVKERKIMNITGHKSLSMLREYIQDGELFRDHPVRGLFQNSHP